VSATDASESSAHVVKSLLAAGSTAKTVTASSGSASAVPNWLLIAILALVALVVIAMFSLTFFSMSAPRSTLKNVMGRGRSRGKFDGVVTEALVRDIANDARAGKRTTRTTLAIAGFSLLGIVVVAIFGLSGQGVQDLRSQAVASVTTLAAAIVGFYFGAQTASKGGSSGGNANNESSKAAAATGTDPSAVTVETDEPSDPDSPTVPVNEPDVNVNAGRAGGRSAS
jgi:hypothetical protein